MFVGPAQGEEVRDRVLELDSPFGEPVSTNRVGVAAFPRVWNTLIAYLDPTSCLVELVSVQELIVKDGLMFEDRSRARSPNSHIRRRRNFLPRLGRDALARSCPSRLPKIKIQTRRLLSPSPLKCRPSPPRPPAQRTPPASSSPVAPTLIQHHGGRRAGTYTSMGPRMCFLPHLIDCRRRLRPARHRAHPMRIYVQPVLTIPSTA